MSWQGLINTQGQTPNRGPPRGPTNLFPAPNSIQRASNTRGRNKVVLEPGHSPLDWAELKSSGKNLRNIDPSDYPMRVTKEELKKHRTLEDCWTVIKGKVYNITPYLKFHPGGVDEIMKGAGLDATVMFNKYHSWVNADRMLDGCFIGFYVKV